MTSDLIKCQCSADCRCEFEAARAVMRHGKAFCSEACANGHSCGCNRGLCPAAPIL
ncbi:MULTISPECIES: conjugal transfer protein TrbI [unclassified Synechococcus]|uniref:conjugal transfer protein TrbI n=1 Tax=unclassified Synechococcus TaxID=2626047 RepID=UPI0039AF09D1